MMVHMRGKQNEHGKEGEIGSGLVGGLDRKSWRVFC